MLEEMWLILLGFGAGAIGSMVGFGGGVVIAPVLTFMGFPPALAASNSLFGAFGNISAAVLTHTLKRRLKYSLGLKMGLVSVPGTVLGALLSGYVESDVFKILFGVILVVISAYILTKGRMRAHATGNTWLVVVLTAGASFSAGIVSSFFGVGGGIIFVPLMVLVMGMTMKDGAAAAQPALLVAAFAGLVSHSMLGHPDFYQAMLLMAGGFGGGLLGVRVSRGLGDRHLRVIVSVLITAAAVRLFWEALDEMYRGGALFAVYGLPSEIAGSGLLP